MRMRFALSALAVVLFTALSLGQTATSPTSAQTSQNWGPTKRGVRVALNVDKTTYRLGEDVPLHIAVENVSAAHPIYGEPFRPRSAFGDHSYQSIKVTVQDEDGPLTPWTFWTPSREGIPTGSVSGGPALCPAPYMPDQPVTFEKSLRRVTLLPNTPGTYKVTVTSSPFTSDILSCDKVPAYDSAAPHDKPYVSVSSNAVVEIIGDSGSVGTKEYTAWKQHLLLIDTSFGEKTALLDTATHLEWLRLNFSASLSYNQVTAQMTHLGQFVGWRYATAAELRTFFKHFIGSSDTTSDPLIEAKLQRLMGGPLSVASSPETGWYRTSSLGLVEDKSHLGRQRRGYIANDHPGGAIATPEIWGYTTDDYPVEGSYLVKRSYLVKHR